MIPSNASPPPLPRLRLAVSNRTADSTLNADSNKSAAAITDDAAFARDARLRAGSAPHAILLSGGEHPCSQRSIAAIAPSLILEVKNGCCTLRSERGSIAFDMDPFELIDSLIGGLDTVRDAAVPFMAGYVAYEAGRHIEHLPAAAEDRLGLPDILFLFPSTVLIFDRHTSQVTEQRLEWSDELGPLPPIDLAKHERREVGMPEKAVSVNGIPEEAGSEAGMPEEAGSEAGMPEEAGSEGVGLEYRTTASDKIRRGFSREEYIAAVERVRGFIYEGDVYQVNLSQRFGFPLREDPFAFWLRLFEANPAPFYAWIDAGSHQVLSASMERFFRIDGGRRIETRPIKGTRPRGRDEAEAARLAEELLGSAKDDAELSMIVDLERNDLGKICDIGSVRVAEHKRIERYANVMHLVSVVEGQLPPEEKLGDVFRALFPGGSITGCPKIRAMEIIDELEPETRHVYTGAIGYAATDGGADFSIAIRTAVVKDGLCHLSVGGGVVFDSDPLAEYFETLDKGSTFFRLSGIHRDLDQRY